MIVAVLAAQLALLDRLPLAAVALKLQRERAAAVAEANTPSFRGAAQEAQALTRHEWLLSGPAECVAGETRIFNPFTGGSPTIGELAESGQRSVVLTASGPAVCGVPFRKGYARLYRVTMTSGRSFVASARHLLLTQRGWTFVEDLACGDAVPSSEPIPLESTAGAAPRGSRRDAFRSTRTAPSSAPSCSADLRQHGERLRWEAGADRAVLPSRADASGRSHADCTQGDPGASRGRSRQDRRLLLPSSEGFPLRLESTAYAGWSASGRTPRPCDASSRSLAPLGRTSPPLPAELGGAADCGSTLLRTNGSGEPPRAGAPSGLERARALPEAPSWQRRASLRTAEELHSAALESFDASPSLPFGLLPSAYYTVRPDTVASVARLREDWYYDLTVPGAAHYFAEGFWHHNTGKTFAGLWRLDTLLRQTPGATAVIARKVRSDMGTTVLRTWDRITAIRGNVRTRGGSHPEAYEYENGSIVFPIGLDRPGKVLSGEFDFVYVNQAEECAGEDWETLTTRVTGRGAVTQTPMIFGDCNPGPPSHWILARPTLRLYHSRHADNPTLFRDDGSLTEQGERTMRILDALVGVRRERLYFGRWVAAEGVVYEAFDRAVHEIDRFEIPPDWRRIRAIDFGFNNPFVCHWWAIDPDDRMYLYRELYRTGRIVEDHARQIRELSAGESISATVADHDSEDRATLARHGVPTVPAYKAIERGIQAVQARLRPAGDGRPRLFFFRDALVERDESLAEARKPCSTVQEIEVYSWRKSADGKPIKEEPAKLFDHGQDAMRYGVAFLDIAGNGDIAQSVTAESATFALGWEGSAGPGPGHPGAWA